jgi:predicted nucleic acid-binding protein
VAEPAVVDTNVLFSALLRKSARFAEVLLTSDRRFLINELVVVELFKHKEKIVRLSRLGDEDVVHLFYELLRELELYKEELVAPANRAKAAELCQDVDLTDAPRVAIALETGGPSGQATWGKPNQKLKQGLRAKGFARFFEPPR